MLFGPEAQRKAQELMEKLDLLTKQMGVVANEFELRRKMGAADVVWDQHGTLSVAAGANQAFDLLRDWGKLGVAATVVSSSSGGKVGVNGSTPFTVLQGDAFDRTRFGTIRLDNSAGSATLEVVVFLASAAALGVGARA